MNSDNREVNRLRNDGLEKGGVTETAFTALVLGR